MFYWKIIIDIFCFFQLAQHAKYPDSNTTPPVPIDLIWHVHLASGPHYDRDMKRLLVSVYNCDRKKMCGCAQLCRSCHVCIHTRKINHTSQGHL